MTLWLHSVIFAAALTAAGIASAAAYYSLGETTAPKSDRMVWADDPLPVQYLTVEERGSGISVLTRVAVP